ncbi:hypothetical protein PVAP13_9KG484900 [Panicum virgatum]|uniref:OTU domain-containing protein n=1 Tax=Panicum virgatum TaxID=38727 RepID=A0A8T0NTY8_PANVG|nr:hypothetical protein PVAP13_9KG484900 [Panicum virgatum]
MVQKKKKAAAPAKLRKPPKRDAGKKLGKKADMTEFRAQLDSLGLKIVEVNSDGNCFFRFRTNFYSLCMSPFRTGRASADADLLLGVD